VKAPDEWDASTYHRLSDPQFAWGQKVLARLPLRGDETVIDAGCGTGRLTAVLLERLPRGQVIAVDASEQMIEQARVLLAPRFGPRLSFVNADLLTLDLRDSADCIFSTATFHWIKDHPALFRRLHAALKPGGRLLAQCGGGPNLSRTLARASEILSEPEYEGNMEGWSETWEFADAETTEARLRDAGFDHVHASLESETPVFPNARDYRQFLATVIFRPHLRALPDQERRDRFLDRMTVLGAADDPPFSLDYWRLNFDATRPRDGKR